MTIREIAEQSRLSERRIYQIAKQLGRMPTLEEVEKRKEKRGRPNKYGNSKTAE